MITLITGTPGSGKTLYTVSRIIDEEYRGRDVYVHGIPDLVLPHTPADDPHTWHEWLPDGAVLVVDEAQSIWRPRAPSAPVPPSVSAMETHRHRGVDIVLVTQSPMLIDAGIRRLVGRHLHVRRIWGWPRAIVYEWDSAQDPGRTSAAIKRVWSYPRRGYALYRSAVLHHRPARRVPAVALVAVASAIAAPTLGYLGYSHLYDTWTAEAQPAHGGDTPAPPAGAPVAGADTPVEPQLRHSDVAIALLAHTPRVPDDPASAPLYDGMRRPADYPRIVACIASSSRCVCYTQQATPVSVSRAHCIDRAHGRVYDPYVPQADPQVVAPAVLTTPPPPAPTDAALTPDARAAGGTGSAGERV